MNYFDQLSFEDTFSRAFTVFGRRWKSFLTIAFLVYVAGWLSAILFSLLFGGDTQIDGYSYSTSYVEASIQSPGARAFYLFETFLYYCFCCLAHGAAIYFVAHFYLNQNPDIEEAFRRGFWKLHYLILVTILVLIIVVLPIIVLALIYYFSVRESGFNQSANMLLILVGTAWNAFIVVKTYVVYPIIMTEDMGPLESIKRSWSLTNASACYIFGVLFVWALLKVITGLVLSSLLYQSYPYTDNKALLVFVKVFDTLIGIFFLAIGPV
jgi:hypothetical protein